MKLNQDLSALVKGLSVGFQVGLDNSASYWDNNTMNFGYEQATMNWETGETTYNTLRNEGTLSFSKSVGSSVNHFNLGPMPTMLRTGISIVWLQLCNTIWIKQMPKVRTTRRHLWM